MDLYETLSQLKQKLEEANEGEFFFSHIWADKAWMLNKIILHMNDEEAYYSSGWLYIWPDGESFEDCRADFTSKEDYEELEDLFIKIYKNPEYHEAGLYRLSGENLSDSEWKAIVNAAHEWDKKLNLSPIEDMTIRR